jgi:hypothetical protein
MEKVVVRLDIDTLAALEKELPPPVVTNATSELMAGYQLGVQAVLQKLRAGYAISRR